MVTAAAHWQMAKRQQIAYFMKYASVCFRRLGDPDSTNKCVELSITPSFSRAILKEMGLQKKMSTLQAKKKWDNLQMKYKVWQNVTCKHPPPHTYTHVLLVRSLQEHATQ